MAEEREMTVGAEGARLISNRVGVRPESEKGVVERGGWPSADGGDATRVASETFATQGLVERPPFSSWSLSTVARLRLSWSLISSLVLAVFRFVPPPSGLRPTTVP